MFWEMDAEGHRAALGSISDFLLSVFAFAASKEDGGFQRKEWLVTPERRMGNGFMNCM